MPLKAKLANFMQAFLEVFGCKALGLGLRVEDMGLRGRVGGSGVVGLSFDGVQFQSRKKLNPEP